MDVLFKYVTIVIYVALGLIALWGAFCVIIVWRRVASVRFRTEEEQDLFLDQLDENLERRDLDSATQLCDGDERAISQLALLAVSNRRLGYAKIRTLVADRFQRDVLSDLEHRLSWVDTIIKAAPMVGLLGTVIGMMGAFGELAVSNPEAASTAASTPDARDAASTSAGKLAENISFALITTACGLAIAIPLVFCKASINVRIRKLEDLVSSGLTRFLETFRTAMAKPPAEGT
ncbi:MAG: MotA/TolQ/ExbB proton channel family protein [Planctomycetota bacterium]|jgi:biopolymer transport protein ExbB/TolQ